MRISDWSSERVLFRSTRPESHRLADHCSSLHEPGDRAPSHGAFLRPSPATQPARSRAQTGRSTSTRSLGHLHVSAIALDLIAKRILEAVHFLRSEEHTSELQSLMRISYAVFCLKKKNKKSPIQQIKYLLI